MWIAPPNLAEMSQSWSGNPSEWNGYVGIPLALLLGWIAVRNMHVLLVRWASLLGMLATVLSLGPHLHLNGTVHHRMVLPWSLVQSSPIFVHVLPSRLALYLFLAAALLLAVFVRGLESPFMGWRSMAGWLALVLALLPLLPREPTPVAPTPVPKFFSSEAGVGRLPPSSVALVLPFTTDPGVVYPGEARHTAVDAMVWQAHSDYRFRMPSGYVIVPGPGGQPSHGPVPTDTSRVVIAIADGEAPSPMTPDLRRALAADFQRWQVRTVIVGPMPHQAGELSLISDLLGRPPEQVGGVYVWWDVSSQSIVPT
jgi:hypothetical protein